MSYGSAAIFIGSRKCVGLRDSSAKCQNSLVCLRKMCLMVLRKRTFYRNDDLSIPGGGRVLPYMGYIGMCRC